MELYLNRREIRRRMLARLGNTTNDSQAPLVMDQFNEFIRAAVQAVYTRCPWSHALRETRVDIGIDQRFVNYPSMAGAGNIQAIALWDATAQRYCNLQRGRIPLEADDDPVVDLGEPDSIAGRAAPTVYELKTQIELWPRADQAYELKIDHTISPDLAGDDDVSVVDAEAVILWAMADAYDFQGDDRLSQVARRKYEERIQALIGSQHPLPTIRRGRYSLNNKASDSYEPNSGLWPSRMPT